ncbi:ferric reductase NAD binding domain-containing protein [Fusarium acuminatum]|uniref:ferric-chelate reductase (NADPH) n=1 Tax=Fusarium acuminatum TaxID=5515 RepID=A0ABZ2X9I8_9HYPO
MGAANMALCVFFGLKNTPLGPLAAVSHSQLNVLHRIVGYSTVFLVLLHAAVYTIHFGCQGRLMQLFKMEDIAGMGAGVAMLILLMGIFRHKRYELFYISHIIGFLSVVLLTALHRPNWTKKMPVVMLVVFSVWMLDRLIRLIGTLSNLANNSATFYPLADGGTRVILKKPGAKAALPGSHCFLWTPKLRAYESHPFTIVSNDSFGLELVMKSHEGFTKAVESFACQHPGSTLWASIDGPYGSLPDANHYDKLILVAGGSGAAFTFGFANRLMMQPEKVALQSIEFIWAVRRIGEVESESLLRDNALNYGTASGMCDIGELFQQTTFDEQTLDLNFEKVNIDVIISESLKIAGRHQRVLVASCGPKSLMDDVVDSAHKWQNKRGLRIDVHCEDFDGC